VAAVGVQLLEDNTTHTHLEKEDGRRKNMAARRGRQRCTDWKEDEESDIHKNTKKHIRDRGDGGADTDWEYLRGPSAPTWAPLCSHACSLLAGRRASTAHTCPKACGA